MCLILRQTTFVNKKTLIFVKVIFKDFHIFFDKYIFNFSIYFLNHAAITCVVSRTNASNDAILY